MNTQPVTRVPGHLTVREARDLYLRTNGFSMAAYTEPTFALPIFGREVRFPNPPARQRAIARHDIHHVLTGYGTDYAGEGEIGAWELRAGCTTFFLWAINILAVLGGLVVAPRRIVRAFRAAGRQRTLYRDLRDDAALLELRVDELRRQLGIPEGGHTAHGLAPAPVEASA